MSHIIKLTGLTAFGHHGVYEKERETGQSFVCDIELEADLSKAAQSDDLADTVNYAELAEKIVQIMQGPPVNLIETLAENILQCIFSYPAALEASVTVHKPQAPLEVSCTDVSVTIARTRSDLLVTGAIPVVDAESVEYQKNADETGPAESAVPDQPVDRKIVLALGANLNDPVNNLRQAVSLLREDPQIEVLKVSPLVRTSPVLLPDSEEQPDYYNAVVIAESALEPAEILKITQAIEKTCGRETSTRWAARALDIDLIEVAGVVADDPELTLPHPRAHERAFVLLPWALTEPGAQLGEHGDITTLAEHAPDRSGIREMWEGWWDSSGELPLVNSGTTPLPSWSKALGEPDVRIVYDLEDSPEEQLSKSGPGTRRSRARRTSDKTPAEVLGLEDTPGIHNPVSSPGPDLPPFSPINPVLPVGSGSGISPVSGVNSASPRSGQEAPVSQDEIEKLLQESIAFMEASAQAATPIIDPELEPEFSSMPVADPNAFPVMGFDPGPKSIFLEMPDPELDPVLAGQVSPEDVLPEDVSPEEVLPAEVLPEEVLPAHILPEDVSPERALPEEFQAESGETLPGKIPGVDVAGVDVPRDALDREVPVAEVEPVLPETPPAAPRPDAVFVEAPPPVLDPAPEMVIPPPPPPILEPAAPPKLDPAAAVEAELAALFRLEKVISAPMNPNPPPNPVVNPVAPPPTVRPVVPPVVPPVATSQPVVPPVDSPPAATPPVATSPVTFRPVAAPVEPPPVDSPPATSQPATSQPAASQPAPAPFAPPLTPPAQAPTSAQASAQAPAQPSAQPLAQPPAQPLAQAPASAQTLGPAPAPASAPLVAPSTTEAERISWIPVHEETSDLAVGTAKASGNATEAAITPENPSSQSELDAAEQILVNRKSVFDREVPNYLEPDDLVSSSTGLTAKNSEEGIRRPVLRPTTTGIIRVTKAVRDADPERGPQGGH